MKKIKSILRQIALFSLGIVFSACMTVLAGTINTKINSNKLQANLGEIEDVDAAISGLVTQTYNLETRIAALETILPKYYDTSTDSLELNAKRELSAFGGHLDFHYAGSTADYTSRIIEPATGVINFEVNKLKINYNSFLSAASAITPTVYATGSIPENKSFKMGNATFLNFQYVVPAGVRLQAGRPTTIAILPEGSRPSSIAQCSAQTQAGNEYAFCYVDTAGQVIINTNSTTLSNKELRITGAFIQ